MTRTTPVALRVKALREHLGMSQPDLARASGTDVDNIKKTEQGRNQLSSADMRDAIARGFGLAPDDFRAYLKEEIDLATVLARRRDPTSETPPSKAPQSPRGAAAAFDEAVAKAFRASERFTLADVDAVRRVLTDTRTMQRSEADLENAARGWLEAAANLRARGEAVTVGSLMFELATTPRERDAISRRSDELNAAGDQQLRRVAPSE